MNEYFFHHLPSWLSSVGCASSDKVLQAGEIFIYATGDVWGQEETNEKRLKQTMQSVEKLPNSALHYSLIIIQAITYLTLKLNDAYFFEM